MPNAAAVNHVGDELDAPVGVSAEGGDDAGFGRKLRDDGFGGGFEVTEGAGIDPEEKEIRASDSDEAGDGPFAQCGATQNHKAEDGANRGEARDEKADPGGVHRDAEVFGEGGDGEEGHEVELDGQSEIAPPVGVTEIAEDLDEEAEDAEGERDPGEGCVAVAVDHELIGSIRLPERQAAFPVGGELGAMVEIPAED